MKYGKEITVLWRIAITVCVIWLMNFCIRADKLFAIIVENQGNFVEVLKDLVGK